MLITYFHNFKGEIKKEKFSLSLTVHVEADLGVLALGRVRLVHGHAAERVAVQVPVGGDAHVRGRHEQAVVVLLGGVRLVGLSGDVLRPYTL